LGAEFERHTRYHGNITEHSMRARVCVCVCVCVRERERERQTRHHGSLISQRVVLSETGAFTILDVLDVQGLNAKSRGKREWGY
jgi:hypothetical protein